MDLEAGYQALGRGDWPGARVAFTRAVASGAGPGGWEGLAEAARWLGDIKATFAARERAYRLYQQSGEDRAAARMAIWLAYDTLTMRGGRAVAEGWFARAHRLLDGDQGASERGWLAYREGELAIVVGNDPVVVPGVASELVDISGGAAHSVTTVILS